MSFGVDARECGDGPQHPTQLGVSKSVPRLQNRNASRRVSKSRSSLAPVNCIMESRIEESENNKPQAHERHVFHNKTHRRKSRRQDICHHHSTSPPTKSRNTNSRLSALLGRFFTHLVTSHTTPIQPPNRRTRLPRLGQLHGPRQGRRLLHHRPSRRCPGGHRGTRTRLRRPRGPIHWAQKLPSSSRAEPMCRLSRG